MTATTTGVSRVRALGEGITSETIAANNKSPSPSPFSRVIPPMRTRPAPPSWINLASVAIGGGFNVWLLTRFTGTGHLALFFSGGICSMVILLWLYFDMTNDEKVRI